MLFTTPVPIAESSHKISYNSNIVSLGSCFAVNIGQKLDYFKFQNTTNPFGILFNPLALEKIIGFAVNDKTFTEADIFYYNERWQCYDVHSELSHRDKDTFLLGLNTAKATLAKHITSTSHIIITLGTAWIYRLKTTGEAVANCHKVPQKEFNKEILSVSSIEESLKNIINMVKQAKPDVTIIFTISPVRHIKDGFTENQRSKANLIAALHNVITGNTDGIYYFPSYEIVMDELRDYRFYAEDMIHPNPTAINYIWERFTNAWLDNNATKTMSDIDGIMKSLQHRPFNPESKSYKKFIENLGTKIAILQREYPHIKF